MVETWICFDIGTVPSTTLPTLSKFARRQIMTSQTLTRHIGIHILRLIYMICKHIYYTMYCRRPKQMRVVHWDHWMSSMAVHALLNLLSSRAKRGTLWSSSRNLPCTKIIQNQSPTWAWQWRSKFFKFHQVEVIICYNEVKYIGFRTSILRQIYIIWQHSQPC